MKNYTTNYIDTFHYGINQTKYKINSLNIDSESFFQQLNDYTKEVKKIGGRLFFFGNGASAAFSNHMAIDWSKIGGLLSFSLSDSAMITALANDYDFEGCFLEFLKINSPTSNDLIITTSASGNSPNIVKVLQYCKEKNISSFGLSGLNEGNKTENLSKFSLFVPMKTYGMVECIHQLFHHIYFDKFMGVEEWNRNESQNMEAKNFKL